MSFSTGHIQPLHDRRKYQRFYSSTFRGHPISLCPMPPYFGGHIEGEIIDLSAGGMAILLKELVPLKTHLTLELTFPDRSFLRSNVKICYAKVGEENFQVGIEFLNLSSFMQAKIEKMSSDFLICEDRIKDEEEASCDLKCSFFNMCDKKTKKNFVQNLDNTFQARLKDAA